MKLFVSPHIRRLIDLALDEDDLTFDVTSNIFFEGRQAQAILRAKSDLVIAGLPVFAAVFERVDPTVRWTFDVEDGSRLARGTVFARGVGEASSLLKAERTGLNFLQRMSGVATLTRSYVDALGDSTARICDTRKTLPGWRELDKYAVNVGGGANHRISLSGGVMLKDNHIAAAGGVAEAMAMVRDRAPHTLRVEVEVENFEQLTAAISAGAEIIMLDNMSTPEMRRAVEHVRKTAGRQIWMEASGNVTLERLPELRDLGLDFISSGALTHSAIAADISMRMETL